MSGDHHGRLILGIGLCLALAVRIAACVLCTDDLTRDRDVYLGIAENVAAGRGYCSPGSTAATAYRPPLYPLLLAGALAVLPSAAAVALVNIVFGLLTVVAVWSLGRRWALSCRGRALAVGVIALDPLLMRYTAQPMTECVFAGLTAAAIWALLAALADATSPDSARRPVVRWWSAGFLLGLAALCRPTIWPFIAVLLGVGVVAGFCRRATFLRPATYAGAFVVGLIIATAPWALRNAWVFGRPIVTTTHGGYTLFLANNPVFYADAVRQPWGTVWGRESLERWQQEQLAQMEAELGPNAGEAAWDRWQARQGRRAIQADPSGFAAAVGYRVRSFWSLLPRNEGAPQSAAVRAGVGGFYAALFSLAAVGTVAAWRERRPGLGLLLTFLGCVQAVHLVYWTDTRMRAPLHPILALLAAAAVDALRRVRAERPRRPADPSAAG